MKDFEGKVVVVIGGVILIGVGVVCCLCSYGVKVVLFDIDVDGG